MKKNAQMEGSEGEGPRFEWSGERSLSKEMPFQERPKDLKEKAKPRRNVGKQPR